MTWGGEGLRCHGGPRDPLARAGGGAAPVSEGLRAPPGDGSDPRLGAFRAPRWGEQPWVGGGFKAHVWGIQTSSVNIWARSGFLTPQQQGRSPSTALGKGRAGPRLRLPPVLAHPHTEPPALVSDPGLGVDGVGPVPSCSLQRRGEDPTA